jgi:hydrogenase-4 component F
MVLLVMLSFLMVGAVISGLVPWSRLIGWIGVVTIGSVLSFGIVLAVHVVRRGPVVALDGVFRVDALSAFMVIVVGLVGTLACWQSVSYLTEEVGAGRCSPRHASLYGVLVQLFLTAMLLAVIAGNLGVVWIAIEATTIATTFLVGHRRTRGALEASWKYIAICSVGIALAFLGTVLVYLAGRHAGLHGPSSLNWVALNAASHGLDHGVMRLAMSLVVLGYGTKVGLFPMYSWLPDAHSQAPAPVSALMSGVLLSVGFYAILRFKSIADGSLGIGFSRSLLIAVGLSSLVVATSMLLAQQDYKRMLAYSSMEHMGIIALGAAAGTSLAIAAVLLHVIGHGIAKGVMFLTSGEILATEGTSEISRIKSLLVRRPVLGGLFGFGLLALLGFPPFSLFISELNMLRAEVQVGLGWVAALGLGLMAVIFAAMLSHGRQMLLGSADDDELPVGTSRMIAAPLVSALVLCGAIGMLAWPLSTLLHAAARVVAP